MKCTVEKTSIWGMQLLSCPGGGGIGSGDVHSAAGDTAGRRSLLLPPSSSSSSYFLDPEAWSNSKNGLLVGQSAPAAAGPEHIHSALDSHHGGGGSGGHDEDEDDYKQQSPFAQQLASGFKKLKISEKKDT